VNNVEKLGVKDVRDFKLPPRYKRDLAVFIGLVTVGNGTETLY